MAIRFHSRGRGRENKKTEPQSCLLFMHSSSSTSTRTPPSFSSTDLAVFFLRLCWWSRQVHCSFFSIIFYFSRTTTTSTTLLIFDPPITELLCLIPCLIYQLVHSLALILFHLLGQYSNPSPIDRSPSLVSRPRRDGSSLLSLSTPTQQLVCPANKNISGNNSICSCHSRAEPCRCAAKVQK